MKNYEIEDYSGQTINLMQNGKIIQAPTGRKALDIYLKGTGIKAKVSASKDVHFKVSPVCFEGERKFYDHRNGQRALWYQIQIK